MNWESATYSKLTPYTKQTFALAKTCRVQPPEWSTWVRKHNGPELLNMQLQQQWVHQPPKHGTAPPQPNSPPHDLCPRRIQSPKAADDDYIKGLLLFIFFFPCLLWITGTNVSWRRAGCKPSICPGDRPSRPAHQQNSPNPSACRRFADTRASGISAVANICLSALCNTDTGRYFVSSGAPGDAAPPAAAATYGEDSEGPFKGGWQGRKQRAVFMPA